MARIVSEGTKTVAAAATPERIVAATLPLGKNGYVWIGAPCDANGVAANTKPAFVGSHATASVRPLLISNFEGVKIPAEDAYNVYVKIGANGETVKYQCVTGE